MVIGRVPDGSIKVCYETPQEMLVARSCSACEFFKGGGCAFYSRCRAGKRSFDRPMLFTPVNYAKLVNIFNRGINGSEFIHVYRAPGQRSGDEVSL